MNYSLNVTFQVISDTHAKAFVNERFVGNLNIRKVKNKGKEQTRLVFRDSSNPFRNFVKLSPYRDLDNTTITAELADCFTFHNLIPIVLRNFLYKNDAFLAA